jgi:hypothetical protein
VDILGDHCFAKCQSLATVTFESGCKVRRIENYAFSPCQQLKFFDVPASLEIVCESAFRDCASLENVSFERQSNLNRIERSAFESCSSLKSFCVPASVEIIGENCFRCCKSLVNLSVEPNSKLRKIQPGSFDQCSSLKSISIRPTVEKMRDMSESGHPALSKLRFDFPSNVYRLIFTPPESLSSIEIPDSVERVRCSIEFRSTRHFVLNFGSKSNLREIQFQARPPPNNRQSHMDIKPRVFVRVGESTLKGFRSTLELYDGRMPNIPESKSGICMLVSGSCKLDFDE